MILEAVKKVGLSLNFCQNIKASINEFVFGGEELEFTDDKEIRVIENNSFLTKRN